MTRLCKRVCSTCLLIALLGGVCLLCGCAAVAVIDRAIPKSIDAQYKGLAGQKVAVMVWAPLGARIDYPNLQKDTATSVQAYLIAKADEDEFKLTQYPWEARSVVRFQKEHPETEAQAVAEYAPRISGITRLIYVEIGEFATRSETTVQLLKGNMLGNVKVVEIKDGKATTTFQRNGVRVQYPRKSKEGVIDVPESVIYRETVGAFALEVAQLFYGHVIEED